MKVIGVHHTSYTISNLERSLEFYVGLLGCELLWQREISDKYFCDIVGFPECTVRAAHLSIPGSEHVIELFEYVSLFCKRNGHHRDIHSFPTPRTASSTA